MISDDKYDMSCDHIMCSVAYLIWMGSSITESYGDTLFLEGGRVEREREGEGEGEGEGEKGW